MPFYWQLGLRAWRWTGQRSGKQANSIPLLPFFDVVPAAAFAFVVVFDNSQAGCIYICR